MTRGLGDNAIDQIETALLSEFTQRSSAVRGVETSVTADRAPIRHWMTMQHHGAPTRLLDWTSSLFVAAYFACIDDHDVDGAVWMFLGTPLERRMHAIGAPILGQSINTLADIRQHGKRPWCYAFRSATPSERMLAQSGKFTIATDPSEDHATLIHRGAEADTPTNFSHLRILIPAELKPSLLHRLDSMNINAGTLFPGIDGVGRSMRERAVLLRYAFGGARATVAQANAIAAAEASGSATGALTASSMQEPASPDTVPASKGKKRSRAERTR